MNALREAPLVVVVGSGGVGKTTVAAALALLSAKSGDETLVMTFDPSLRLKDALGVGDAAREKEVRVDCGTPAGLWASLLEPQRTFDRLVRRYAPDEVAATRILENRFYRHLAGSLSGILEYMAVERLFEVAAEERFARVVLDTPPTRQAIDFLEAPERIVSFLDSGALRIALRPWFDEHGRLRTTRRLGPLGRPVERFLDRFVGLDLLRDMAEFFQAFGPLYEGFRERALRVSALLRDRRTLFVLVAGPGEERIPETMFFARKLGESGHHLGPVFVNMVHPVPAAGCAPAPGAAGADGIRLLEWLTQRDSAGLAALGALVRPPQFLVPVPLLSAEPSNISGLERMSRLIDPYV